MTIVLVSKKICSKCETALPITEFHKNSKLSDGVFNHCKSCEKIRRRLYYEANRQNEIDYAIGWQKVNPEAKREADRRYNRKHSALHVARVRQWCLDNPEQARRLARRKDATRRARLLGAFVEDVDPILVYERSNGICGICGKEVGMDFHVDHIIPLACGGMHEYANAQAAHPSCNRKKGASTSFSLDKGKEGDLVGDHR